MMEPTTILVIAVLLLLVYIYSTRRHDVFHGLGIPGPRPLPIIGNLNLFHRKGFIEFDEYVREKFGKIVGTYSGGTPFLIIFDVDILKEVMVKQSNLFMNHYEFYRRPFPLRKTILNLRDDDWRRVRHAITPTFTSGKLKKMTSLIFGSVEGLTTKFTEAAALGSDIDMKDFCGRYTLSVISDTMFGMRIDALTNEDEVFTKKAKGMMDFRKRGLIMILLIIFPKLRRIIEYFEWDLIDQKLAQFFVHAVERAIEERKGREEEFHDFLSLMLKAEISDEDAKDSDGGVRGLTNEEILSQALIFMLAGYETTSTGLVNTSYLLAKHPEHQERCREEILAEFCDDSPEQMYESLSRMPYLDHCFKESLRLYPPAARTDRVASEDVTIGSLKIPKGVCIAIPIRMVLRDPELWNEPEQFIPDRFAGDDGDKGKVPFQYLVFGAGPRNCIGMRFAILEAKLALVYILRNVRLVACEKTPEEPLKFNALGQVKSAIILRAEAL